MSEGINIVEVIRAETRGIPAHSALVDGPRSLSYAALLEAVDHVAQILSAKSVKPLDRVAFLCEDSIDYVIGCLAILKLGAVVIPVSPSLMADELDNVLKRMAVHWLIAERSAFPELEADTLAMQGLMERTFFLHRHVVTDDFPAEYAGLNPAFIRFSSGTTGESKGVLLSHDAIVARTDAADQGLRITSSDTVIWVLSMSFHFVVTILLYLRRGATVVICRAPFPESFLSVAKSCKGTVFFASPSHYHILATSPQVPPDCFARFRLAVSTAMKLPAGTATAFRRKFGIELAEAYGIIEVGLPLLNGNPGTPARGSVGRPQAGFEVRILAPDEQGAGAILIRGPGLFDAYVSPWKRRDEVLKDGWFDTGDVGRLEHDGTLTILGRQKNVINSAGMKIFPQEVEDVLSRHPAVSECRVMGVPHPAAGQLPVAEIVFKPGVKQPDTAELRRFCAAHLTAHKVPHEFRRVKGLERTASGKLKRW